jgi:hypothetical protein
MIYALQGCYVALPSKTPGPGLEQCCMPLERKYSEHVFFLPTGKGKPAPCNHTRPPEKYIIHYWHNKFVTHIFLSEK